MAKGEVYRTSTSDDGTFDLKMKKTLRGEGYTIHFQKEGYENASRAAVFRLANHQSEIKDLYMRPLEKSNN